MDPHPSAPPVVAVVVTCDPGPWLEDSLTTLECQDYPNLSVLVIDAASVDDPTPRVASVLPRAYVHRLPQRVGFSTAANAVLGIVEGASHYLFCHDDVALAADVVRVMVEEAFRSNAGIVTPKFVEWKRPDRLLAVGQAIDKFGDRADLVDRGELDQEQHDSVRDVFCAPGGCMLVRADLFSTLQGFDRGVDLFGEDLNLSWRVQVVGGRVVVAPAAVVAHVEALRTGMRDGWQDRDSARRTEALADTHRVRTLITCYGLFHLLRVLPQAVLLSLGQAVVQLVEGHPRRAGTTLMAWPRALARPGQLWSARHALQSRRTASDRELRRLQVRGSAGVRTFVRARLEEREDVAAGLPGAGWTIGSSLRTGAWRLPAAAWLVTIVVIGIGSRGLLGRPIPGIGAIPVTARGPSAWWHLWWSGWRPDGLGSTAPAPQALALLGLAGTLLLGGVGLLQKLLVLGPLLVGPLGAYRAARPLGSPLGRAAALIVYAAVPVPYNALAGGRWPGLVAYAAAPWVLASLCRLGSEVPFVARPRWPARLLALGLLVAVTAAFVPGTLVVVPVMGVGVAVGSMLAGRPRPGLRALVASVGTSVVAALLLLPGSIDVLGSWNSLFGVKLDRSARLGLGQVLRFHTGPVGGSVVGWGLVVAAALPLLIGRSWRLAWASRMWAVAIACWFVVWAASRGWLPLPMATPEVFLAPAAAALALAVGLGAVAFQLDLPGYRFGWRQLASSAAAVGVVLGSFPALAAVMTGRWHLPKRDFSTALSFLPERRAAGAFRVLWLGDPRALPLGSWRFEDGVGYATSNDGAPDVTALWPPRSAGASHLLAANLRLADDRRTTELGHLLAPLGVRYIVVPSATGPAGTGASPVSTPYDVLAGLDGQVDLRTVPVDQALAVYENAAWAPGRSLLAPGAVSSSPSADRGASQPARLAGARAVLAGSGPDRFGGKLPSGADVFFSATDAPQWHVRVGGQAATRRRAFGWAMVFTTPDRPGPDRAGPATLSFATPVSRHLFALAVVALWLVALGAVSVDRRRLLSLGDHGAYRVPAEWVEAEEETLEVAATAARRRWKRTVEPVTVDEEEWL